MAAKAASQSLSSQNATKTPTFWSNSKPPLSPRSSPSAPAANVAQLRGRGDIMELESVQKTRRERNMIRASRKSLIALLLSASILVPLPSLAVAPPEMKQEAAADIDAHASWCR